MQEATKLFLGKKKGNVRNDIGLEERGNQISFRYVFLESKK